MVSTNDKERRSKDGHSACWRLFNKSYFIRTYQKFINEIWLDTMPYKRDTVVNYAYGISADEIEKRVNEYWCCVSLTVPMLVKLNNLNANIGFVNAHDTLAIIHDIEEHVGDWIRALGNPFVKRAPPPFKDFYDLNNLAESIFTMRREIVRITDNSNKDNELGLKKFLKIDTDDYIYKDKYESKINELIRLYESNGYSLYDEENNNGY